MARAVVVPRVSKIKGLERQTRVTARTDRKSKFGAVATPILNSAAVRERYGISDMTLWRWLEARRFPKPFRIGRLRFWRRRELERFETQKL
jgi:predicted DNA-binding transcriptional regulator AlpA